MATVTKTIKSGGDYTSPSAWEEDLDDSSIYSSGDTAVGECSGEHELTSELIMNGGGTVGLTQTRLTAPSADRHDGTAGSGTRFTFDMAYSRILTLGYAVAAVQRTCEWIEFDFEDTVRGGNEWVYIDVGTTADGSTAHLGTFSHNLLHSLDAGSNIVRVLWAKSKYNAVHNNILYDVTSSTGTWVRGIASYNVLSFTACNTVYNVGCTGSGTANGMWQSSGTYNVVEDNISVGTSGTSSSDFNTTAVSGSVNLSSDSSAPGASAVHGEAAADIFVSTTGGSEDLHLKSGAAAIGAGYDIGTSYSWSIHGGVTVGSSTFGTSVNYDIDNYNREDADAWDIGADQYVAASTGGGTAPIVLATTMAGL